MIIPTIANEMPTTSTDEHKKNLKTAMMVGVFQTRANKMNSTMKKPAKKYNVIISHR